MKIYRGFPDRIGKGGFQVEVENNGHDTLLNPRHDLRNHSPDGFAWGYGGSGPSQLALALLADVFDDEIAQRFYQEFKFKVIAGLPQDEPWQLTEAEIKDCVATL